MIRLDRCLTMLGIGSRNEVKNLIRDGSVQIDGQVVRKPDFKFDPEAASIAVRGKVHPFKWQRTIMMNKAAGVLTAAWDPKQRTVLDDLPPLYRAMDCMPAGRLDKDTTGLLILTTDGELAHRLISPNKEVGKTYEAVLDGQMTDADVDAFSCGMTIRDADGEFTAKPSVAETLEVSDSGSTVRLVIREGKYHQVKRMFAARGLTVLALRRVRIGQLWLDEALGPGEFRELTDEEIGLLTESGQEE